MENEMELVKIENQGASNDTQTVLEALKLEIVRVEALEAQQRQGFLETRMSATACRESVKHCEGCVAHTEQGGCTRLMYWFNGVPEKPLCYQKPANKLPPEFSIAMHEHMRLNELHGDDSVESRRSFMLAMSLAPDWFIDGVDTSDIDRMLAPAKPSGYNDADEPLYSLIDIAECIGITSEEAHASANMLIADRAALGLSNAGIVTDPTLVHRVQ
jgi:hypothetical protein